MSCIAIQLVQLESQHTKGGIPRATPHILAYMLHSLPPILYRVYRNSISSYSKAPRGLSVLLRVTGVFTSTTISPGPLLRQRSDRYTFRAGRNLPDKEFRYLRTVIVTAAVYWGFSSKLRLAANLALYPSSTGQVSDPILRLAPSAESCVLVKQSPEPGFCEPKMLTTYSLDISSHSFSRSYGVNLQSSLTRVIPFTLAF